MPRPPSANARKHCMFVKESRYGIYMELPIRIGHSPHQNSETLERVSMRQRRSEEIEAERWPREKIARSVNYAKCTGSGLSVLQSTESKAT